MSSHINQSSSCRWRVTHAVGLFPIENIKTDIITDAIRYCAIQLKYLMPRRPNDGVSNDDVRTTCIDW
jgi:hypothetical protein